MPEPRASALLPLVLLFLVIASDVWLYADAKACAKRGRPVVFSNGTFTLDTPEAWFLGSLLVWIVVVPLYLSSRNK